MKSNFPKIPLFLSIMFFIVSLSAFLFLHKTINNSNAESQSKETEWKSEALRRDAIKALDNSIKMIEGDRMQLETHFAQSSNAVPFLDAIEALAPKVGAKTQVTSVDIAKDGSALVVGMTASGTFSSLYKFLTLLENSPYELEFMTVDMHRQSSGEVVSKGVRASGWSVTLKMKLLSFVN
ncbi:MAG: hypothetical protein V4699_03305 [Patescibacteria group bacterium]